MLVSEATLLKPGRRSFVCNGRNWRGCPASPEVPFFWPRDLRQLPNPRGGLPHPKHGAQTGKHKYTVTKSPGTLALGVMGKLNSKGCGALLGRGGHGFPGHTQNPGTPTGAL